MSWYGREKRGRLKHHGLRGKLNRAGADVSRVECRAEGDDGYSDQIYGQYSRFWFCLRTRLRRPSRIFRRLASRDILSFHLAHFLVVRDVEG